MIKDADQVEILATNQLDDRIAASAAVVGNQLSLRDHEDLYGIGE